MDHDSRTKRVRSSDHPQMPAIKSHKAAHAVAGMPLLTGRPSIAVTGNSQELVLERAASRATWASSRENGRSTTSMSFWRANSRSPTGNAAENALVERMCDQPPEASMM